MDCPFCYNADTKVTDSRPEASGKSIRRRRECLSCNKRWRTVERIEDEMPLVIKKNGSYQHYNREKLLQSLRVACGKRPVSPGGIEHAAAEVEWAILERGLESIKALTIGEMVMEHLKKLDEIAYVRYASVYRQFKDMADLVNEMKEFLPPPREIS
jgi:transcriptional repressor NrdR